MISGLVELIRVVFGVLMWWIVVDSVNIGIMVENKVMLKVRVCVCIGWVSVVSGVVVMKCSRVIVVDISMVSVVKCCVLICLIMWLVLIR